MCLSNLTKVVGNSYFSTKKTTHISKNIQYPQQAKIKRIKGKVLVQFVITDKGKVSDVEVIKSAHPLLNEEARRVVNSMPDWKPAKFMGEHVYISYQIPISFKLSAFW